MNSVLSSPFYSWENWGQSEVTCLMPTVRSVVELGFEPIFCRIPNPMQTLVFFISLRGGTFPNVEAIGIARLFCAWVWKASPVLWGREPDVFSLDSEGCALSLCWSLGSALAGHPTPYASPYTSKRSGWFGQLQCGPFGVVSPLLTVSSGSIPLQSSGASWTNVIGKGSFWGTDIEFSRRFFC